MKPSPTRKPPIRVAVVESDPLRFIGFRTLFDSEKGIDLPAAQRSVGYVFQTLALFPHLSVGGNIGYGLAAQGMPKGESAVLAAHIGGFTVGAAAGVQPPANTDNLLKSRFSLSPSRP